MRISDWSSDVCSSDLMHLGDRGRRDRDLLEAGVELCDRLVELFLDGSLRLGGRKGRQPVLQLRQIAGDVLPHQVGADGERLPELDEARAELLQRRRKALAGTPRTPGLAEGMEIGRAHV